MKILKYPNLKGRDFSGEFVFTATRSSGPGGQHVNKVNTCVELRFSLYESTLLTEIEKEIITKKLKTLITAEGELIIVSQSERSQIRNKENCIEKFNILLNKSLTRRKRRIPTQASGASRKRRLETKRKQSEKKSLRKNISDT